MESLFPRNPEIRNYKHIHYIRDTFDKVRIVSPNTPASTHHRHREMLSTLHLLLLFLDSGQQKHQHWFDESTEYENHRISRLPPTIIRKLPFEGEDGILSNYFEVASCSHPPICSISIMVKKMAIQAIGGFPLGIKSGEDLLTWARLAVSGAIVYSRKSLAVFVRDEGLFNKDQQLRVPEKEDIVGLELKKLYNINRHIIGLNKYVALWHKMRTRIFIDKKDRRKAIKECLISMKYNMNVKILVFLVLIFLPSSFSRKVFKFSNTR